MIPERVVIGLRVACVETRLGKDPAVLVTDRGGQGEDIEIRMTAPKRLPGTMIEILAINKRDGSF